MTIAVAIGSALAFMSALLLAGYCVHVLREARRSRVKLRANIERLVLRANIAALADRDRARGMVERADMTPDHAAGRPALLPISAPRRG